MEDLRRRLSEVSVSHQEKTESACDLPDSKFLPLASVYQKCLLKSGKLAMKALIAYGALKPTSTITITTDKELEGKLINTATKGLELRFYDGSEDVTEKVNAYFKDNYKTNAWSQKMKRTKVGNKNLCSSG
eukprot:TRINITY_DN1700_c0_g1_i1.p1 TRINITY_DN1700_c0_g1~~TRINITY_DN1700_c0_g1_i1.p1  ORF type:complete len:143 (-),score=30.15 TRINITY_DN1700_c0_g1_i1:1126-1518(-)